MRKPGFSVCVTVSSSFADVLLLHIQGGPKNGATNA